MSADCGKLKILIISGAPIRVIFQNLVTIINWCYYAYTNKSYKL